MENYENVQSQTPNDTTQRTSLLCYATKYFMWKSLKLLLPKPQSLQTLLAKSALLLKLRRPKIAPSLQQHRNKKRDDAKRRSPQSLTGNP